MITGLFRSLLRLLWRLLRTILADIALAGAAVLLLAAGPVLIIAAALAGFSYLQRPAAGSGEPAGITRSALAVATATIGLAAALRSNNRT